MIKVLVVDDSALMRRVVGGVLRDAGFEVETAKDGMEALERVHAFAPDVVTLDVQMPRMDGLACLDRIMLERPCPVVMLSSLTTEGAETTLDALELGAVDFLAKPDGAVSLSVDTFGPRLAEVVASAAKTRVRRAHRLLERLREKRPPRRAAEPLPRPVVRRAAPSGGGGLVLIGVSTGGPPALDTVLSSLPEDFPWPILVAQHMPATFTGSFAARLNGLCALPVVEVVKPTRIEGGVYIARGDADMIVSRRAEGLVALPAPSSAEHRWHPSVDRLVSSAMDHVAPSEMIGVLMTGMGNDGAAAMTALRAAGGLTIAESEETAVVWGMPGELVRAGGADHVEPLDSISARLMQLVGS
ncbi:chemotaxis-specific protein-glutamate methyltransferase CheB [Caulobacter segnis]|uniref:chemotaxis-specific protein-glutamate methyltransferase CheB n=1 Tax=Caulobacter segnis TaxID=88688 RepID=UPI00285B7DF5|nr:chemotaxis-specific protein-glutamate methyltransferase CheB [Caulobacter segnis]MDR6625556.1 two-component system chemotaxis response regulator CheB [Caulobacter segnis]